MLYIVGMSTPIVFREETGRLCVCGHPEYSERKPDVPYVVGVSTPIVFREENLRAVHCRCEYTYSIQRGKLMCGTLWVWAHP